MKFNSLLPEFYVSDFARSLNFYRDILGFKLEYQRAEPNFTFLSYGKSQLMIQELRPGEKEEMKLEYPFGRVTNYQIDTENVEKLLENLNKNNYPITRGIKDSWRKVKNTLYGDREILVRDPDGYLLRFSQVLEKN